MCDVFHAAHRFAARYDPKMPRPGRGATIATATPCRLTELLTTRTRPPQRAGTTKRRLYQRGELRHARHENVAAPAMGSVVVGR